jgi:hypothetical protein
VSENATSPPAGQSGELGDAISFAADDPKNKAAHIAMQARRSHRRWSRVRRTRIGMLRGDLGEALHRASVSARGSRQRLDAGDLAAAAYLIRLLSAYAGFAAACLTDLDDLGRPR